MKKFTASAINSPPRRRSSQPSAGGSDRVRSLGQGGAGRASSGSVKGKPFSGAPACNGASVSNASAVEA
eukprot:9474717-Pyramimonas_sp.AAC.2